MWHPQRKPHTAGVLAGLIAAGGIFALQGEARATYCQEYETTVMIPPNRPVKAIGRVCQVNGKWYLTTSSRGRWGGDGFSRQPGVSFSAKPVSRHALGGVCGVYSTRLGRRDAMRRLKAMAFATDALRASAHPTG